MTLRIATLITGNLAAGAFALGAVLALSAPMPAFARGAAPTLLNSPGYQRALQESRRRYREEYYGAGPHLRPQAAAPRKKKARRPR